MNLKTIIITLSALAPVPLCADAQTDAPIREIFTTIDTPTLSGLASNYRLDMLDYFDNSLATPVESIYDEEAVITALGSNDISVRLSDFTEAELYLLKCGKDTLVMQITTLYTPGADSEIEFFTTDSKKLNVSKFLPKIYLKDWLAGKMTPEERSNLENSLPFIMAKAVYDPSTGTLTLEGTFEDYLSREAYAMVKNFLKPSLTLRWNGKKFSLVNK